MKAASIEFRNVSKLYGEIAAVKNVSFTVAEGSLVTLLGPLGCSLAEVSLAIPIPLLGTLGPVALSLLAGVGLVILGVLWSRFTDKE